MSVPQNIMVVGNLIGTGTALKVSCGFVPRRVEVLNLTQLSKTTWNYGMTTNWDEGFHEIGSGAGAVDFSLLTANGISTNTGDAINTTLTGTIAGSAGSAAITGTSTEFLTEVAVGEELLIGGIVSIIFIQSIINIGMNIGIMPVTGISLPFLSYGGSFLITIMAGFGIIESVHRVSRK